MFALVDRSWLTAAVDVDPARMDTLTRRGLDRTLDLHHWLDELALE